jgi:hypothetical protein
MKTETKTCEYCGKEIPITANKCRYCYNWVNEEAISRNHIPNHYVPEKPIYNTYNDTDDYLKENIEEIEKYNSQEFKEKHEVMNYNHALPIRRLFLLMFFTMNLYSIYWFYYNSKILKEQYNKNINVWIRTICFALIPIANWVVFYWLLLDWENLIESKGIESFSAPLNLIIYICVPFLGIWTLINVQESMNDFWRIEDLNLHTQRRFSRNEIIVMILFGLLEFLIFLMILFSITLIV